MSKRAIILAGGRGERLKPYTIVLPKPLMPLGDYPILEVVIRQLVSHGFDHITLAVNHLADIIKAFFNNGKKWGIRIDYSLESKPLSTMGPLKLIEDLPDIFLVMNGDVLTDIDYATFYDYHSKNNHMFTVSTCNREVKSEFGVLESNAKGQLTGFKEKPILNYQVSMGIYMISKSVLQYIPSDRPYGFDNLMLDLLEKNLSVATKPHDGFWLDIGRPDDYAAAQEMFEKRNSSFFVKEG